jgi:hypothetical protein
MTSRKEFFIVDERRESHHNVNFSLSASSNAGNIMEIEFNLLIISGFAFFGFCLSGRVASELHNGSAGWGKKKTTGKCIDSHVTHKPTYKHDDDNGTDSQAIVISVGVFSVN